MSTHANILLVGTVPLNDSREVFETVGPALGPMLKRIPDGETGDRQWWVFGKVRKFHNHPDLEPDGHSWSPDSGTTPDSPPKYKLRSDVDPSTFKFDDFGFADAAEESFAEYRRQKEAGNIPPDCRFQVGLPTPLAYTTAMISHESQPAVEAALEARLMTELEEILASIPHDELALQWDVCLEIFIWEGREVNLANPRRDSVDRLVRLGNLIPDDIELGYHLCYGDFNHRHSVEPSDMGIMVEMTNAISAGVRRPIGWFHMPVPRDRDDDAYFQPLDRLTLGTGTELYLGLVHMTDGEDGARRRLSAARQHLDNFGIATECGFGRRAPETIPDLLRLHKTVAAL